MGFKRAIANQLEKVVGGRIIRPAEFLILQEQFHLKRFFDYFRIDCVFDVGANAGQYADMIRDHCAFSGPIISYEPIPELAERMRGRVRDDGRWVVEQKALDARSGFVSLNVMKSDQFSSLHDAQLIETNQFLDHTQVVQRVDVEATTIAAEFKKYKDRFGFARPFLKMDTQGHDLKVAQGAGDHLRKFVGLQSELAIKRIYAEAPTAVEALSFYNSMGFELSAFVPNNAGHFPSLIETDCIMFNPAFLKSEI